MNPPGRKRQRTDDYSSTRSDSIATEVRSRRSAFLASLDRDVSPPGGRDSPWTATTELGTGWKVKSEIDLPKSHSESSLTAQGPTEAVQASLCRIVQSPFKLTRIRDLPANANIDTICAKDILGDVMLKEIWLFDYLYDVDWVMQQFDPDIRAMVSVVLVHGSWRREDSNKIHIDEASKRYPNVRVVTAHMPEMYGCHHSKCMVLFRRDELAQVIIHTANMIEQDWRNLTQGVWLSPLLPKLGVDTSKAVTGTLPAIGTGARFKRDFMTYLRHYGGNRTTDCASQLEQYDFAAIKAALIAHVPAKFDSKDKEPSAQLWGWPALKRALGGIPPPNSAGKNSKSQTAAHIVCQVSSIASLGDKWVRETLFSTLAHCSAPIPTATKNLKATSPCPPDTRFSIIFPTPGEIRTCLDGYEAGASIHCKLQNASHRKQFEFMKPHLCRWDAENNSVPTHHGSPSNTTVGRALRGPAAPHIKTFIRFNKTSAHTEIDWALLTSANLSTQAWGTGGQSGSGEVRVSSYELGVLVWPDLFVQDDDNHDDGTNAAGRGKMKAKAKMIPTFGSDTPTDAQIREVLPAPTTRSTTTADAVGARNQVEGEEDKEKGEGADQVVLVGLRMPYDLPLVPYAPNDEVWSARSAYPEPDLFGRTWNL